MMQRYASKKMCIRDRHTGVIPAAVKAVERVDSLVGDAVQAI